MNLGGLLRRKVRMVPVRVCPTGYRSEGRTHVGRVRAVNEDRLLDRADRGLWAVADGMGGHSGGAAAATTVVQVLDALADDPRPIDDARLRDALARANRAIHQDGSADATSGATVVVALTMGPTAVICWAGDSRAYRIRGGRAEQLTRDHSVVQEMIDVGVLSAAAAERHPQANVVTRALGVAPTVIVDSVRVALEPGDRLLLCSDGVSRSVDPRDFVTMPDSISDSADRFLANALQRDGSDNATLVLVAVS